MLEEVIFNDFVAVAATDDERRCGYVVSFVAEDVRVDRYAATVAARHQFDHALIDRSRYVVNDFQS